MRIDLENGFHIRSYRAADADALVRYANNRNVSRTLRDRFPHPYTEQAAAAWLLHAATEDPERSFAITAPNELADELADELIGGIGLELGDDVHHRSAEIGFWLGEPFWGRGIATRAATAFTSWAFERFDLLRISGCVFENNPASARVLEKAGYRLEGRLRFAVVKNGEAMDQLIYAAVRTEPH